MDEIKIAENLKGYGQIPFFKKYLSLVTHHSAYNFFTEFWSLTGKDFYWRNYFESLIP